MYSRVEDYIRSEIKKYGTLCFPLIDSESQLDAGSVAEKAESLGGSDVLVGGCSVIDQLELSEIVSHIKSLIKIPVILFLGYVTDVSPKADVLFGMFLLK